MIQQFWYSYAWFNFDPLCNCMQQLHGFSNSELLSEVLILQLPDAWKMLPIIKVLQIFSVQFFLQQTVWYSWNLLSFVKSYNAQDFNFSWYFCKLDSQIPQSTFFLFWKQISSNQSYFPFFFHLTCLFNWDNLNGH